MKPNNNRKNIKDNCDNIRKQLEQSKEFFTKKEYKDRFKVINNLEKRLLNYNKTNGKLEKRRLNDAFAKLADSGFKLKQGE